MGVQLRVCMIMTNTIRQIKCHYKYVAGTITTRCQTSIMKPKKGIASTSKKLNQPTKKPTKKTPRKVTTKQNSRKRPASDNDNSEDDSNDEHPKRKKQKRYVEEIDEEESETTEQEEVVESDEGVQLGEDPKANDDVSKSTGSYHN